MRRRRRQGGLAEAFAQAGATQGVYLVDEMRVGLQGQVRVRWGVRGVKLVQTVERAYVWRYLVSSSLKE